MLTIEARRRVVVLDRRRLIREGVSAQLCGVPGVDVVGAVEQVNELEGIDEPFDVIATNLNCDVVTEAVGVSVVTYRDTQTMGALVDALTAESPVVPIRSGQSDGRRLTPREVQVMRGIANGLSSAEIADRLEIAPKSVENHKQRIFAKLQVHSQAHAVSVSLATGHLRLATGVGRDATGAGRPTDR